MTIKRSRSVTLDVRKVREAAAEKGFTTFNLFEAAAPEGNTAKKAWTGIKIDKNKAMDVAVVLGKSHYSELEPSLTPDFQFPDFLIWRQQSSPPGALLKAEYGIVPFHQRHAELENLDEWCYSNERIAVRLYTGPGGIGKTRLAVEQCQRLNSKISKTWKTGFLQTTETTKHRRHFDWLSSEKSAIFLVIDYAETRRPDVVTFLRAALHAKNKIRVVLLARAATDWWTILKTESQGVGDLLMSSATQQMTLQPMFLDHQAKEDSWLIAADSFARQLGHAIPLLPPSDIEPDYFERVLLLHMQALLTVEQEKNDTSGSQGIIEVILNRERRFWERKLAARKLPQIYHQAISLAMARITLIGGIYQQKEAEKLLADIPILEDSKRYERIELAELLHEIYPPTPLPDTKNSFYIAPLQPDLLGEFLLKKELDVEIH